MRVALSFVLASLSVSIVAQSSTTPQPYATFIPGTLFQDVVITPKSGWVYLVGSTTDPNYPTTLDAFDSTCGTDGQCNPVQGRFGPVPAADVVLTVLDAAGEIRYSTFLGGTGRDDNPRLALARDGTLWVAANTTTGAFEKVPTTCSADMLFARFAHTLRRVDDLKCMSLSPLADIELDPDGSLWVLGSTALQVATVNALQPVGGGQFDMFVAHLSPTQAAPLMSTYIGGDRLDLAAALALTPAGDIVVVGRTTSTNFPLVRPARTVAPTLVSQGDAAVAVLDRSGRFLEFSTYWGGRSDDAGTAVAVDSSGYIYVSGETASTDLPVTPDAADRACAVSEIGCRDAFVTRFAATGELIASTFFGGSGFDSGRGIAVQTNGQVVLLGSTQSGDFPLVGSQPFRRWQPSTSREHSYLAVLDPLLATVKTAMFVGDEQMLPNVPRFAVRGAFAYAVGQVGELTGAPAFGTYAAAVRLP